MNVLLDTHILLWALSNDRRLPERAKRLIEDAENDIFYSIASLWEIEIKHLAHPDAMSVSSKEILKRDAQSGFQKIGIKEKHIYAMADLKREKDPPPHKDPFDRMLICQAVKENMIFVTHDSLIGGYSVSCIMTV